MTEACRCANSRISRRIIRRFIVFVVWCVGGVWLRLAPSKTLNVAVRLSFRLGVAYGVPAGM